MDLYLFVVGQNGLGYIFFTVHTPFLYSGQKHVHTSRDCRPNFARITLLT